MPAPFDALLNFGETLMEGMASRESSAARDESVFVAP